MSSSKSITYRIRHTEDPDKIFTLVISTDWIMKNLMEKASEILQRGCFRVFLADGFEILEMSELTPLKEHSMLTFTGQKGLLNSKIRSKSHSINEYAEISNPVCFIFFLC